MILFNLGKYHKTREIFRAVQLQVFKRLYWKLPSLFSVPSTPDAIELELTNKCNLSCPHCHGRRQKTPIGTRPIGEMSYDLFKKLVDEINTYPFCRLLFCGLGEPAMHSDIAKFLDYLKYFRQKVSIVTNGLLLDRFPPEQILDWNIDSLTISVDGFDENSYHQHRPGGNYQQLKANVQSLYEARSKRKSRYPRM